MAKLPKIKSRVPDTSVPPPKASDSNIPDDKDTEKSDITIIEKYSGKPGHNPFRFMNEIGAKPYTEKDYLEWAAANMPKPEPPRKPVDVQKLLQHEKPYSD